MQSGNLQIILLATTIAFTNYFVCNRKF